MRPNTSKDETLVRLKKIEGQIRGIGKMVDEKRYCIDILNQIAAARHALDGVGALLMERHIQTCVSSAIRADKGNVAIAELIDSIRRFVG